MKSPPESPPAVNLGEFRWAELGENAWAVGVNAEVENRGLAGFYLGHGV